MMWQQRLEEIKSRIWCRMFGSFLGSIVHGRNKQVDLFGELHGIKCYQVVDINMAINKSCSRRYMTVFAFFFFIGIIIVMWQDTTYRTITCCFNFPVIFDSAAAKHSESTTTVKVLKNRCFISSGSVGGTPFSVFFLFSLSLPPSFY